MGKPIEMNKIGTASARAFFPADGDSAPKAPVVSALAVSPATTETTLRSLEHRAREPGLLGTPRAHSFWEDVKRALSDREERAKPLLRLLLQGFSGDALIAQRSVELMQHLGLSRNTSIAPGLSALEQLLLERYSVAADGRLFEQVRQAYVATMGRLATPIAAQQAWHLRVLRLCEAMRERDTRLQAIAECGSAIVDTSPHFLDVLVDRAGEAGAVRAAWASPRVLIASAYRAAAEAALRRAANSEGAVDLSLAVAELCISTLANSCAPQVMLVALSMARTAAERIAGASSVHPHTPARIAAAIKPLVLAADVIAAFQGVAGAAAVAASTSPGAAGSGSQSGGASTSMSSMLSVAIKTAAPGMSSAPGSGAAAAASSLTTQASLRAAIMESAAAAGAAAARGTAAASLARAAARAATRGSSSSAPAFDADLASSASVDDGTSEGPGNPVVTSLPVQFTRLCEELQIAVGRCAAALAAPFPLVLDQELLVGAGPRAFEALAIGASLRGRSSLALALAAVLLSDLTRDADDRLVGRIMRSQLLVSGLLGAEGRDLHRGDANALGMASDAAHGRSGGDWGDYDHRASHRDPATTASLTSSAASASAASAAAAASFHEGGDSAVASDVSLPSRLGPVLGHTGAVAASVEMTAREIASATAAARLQSGHGLATFADLDSLSSEGRQTPALSKAMADALASICLILDAVETAESLAASSRHRSSRQLRGPASEDADDSTSWAGGAPASQSRAGGDRDRASAVLAPVASLPAASIASSAPRNGVGLTDAAPSGATGAADPEGSEVHSYLEGSEAGTRAPLMSSPASSPSAALTAPANTAVDAFTALLNPGTATVAAAEVDAVGASASMGGEASRAAARPGRPNVRMERSTVASPAAAAALTSIIAAQLRTPSLVNRLLDLLFHPATARASRHTCAYACRVLAFALSVPEGRAETAERLLSASDLCRESSDKELAHGKPSVLLEAASHRPVIAAGILVWARGSICSRALFHRPSAREDAHAILRLTSKIASVHPRLARRAVDVLYAAMRRPVAGSDSVLATARGVDDPISGAASSAASSVFTSEGVVQLQQRIMTTAVHILASTGATDPVFSFAERFLPLMDPAVTRSFVASVMGMAAAPFSRHFVRSLVNLLHATVARGAHRDMDDVSRQRAHIFISGLLVEAPDAKNSTLQATLAIAETLKDRFNK